MGADDGEGSGGGGGSGDASSRRVESSRSFTEPVGSCRIIIGLGVEAAEAPVAQEAGVAAQRDGDAGDEHGQGGDELLIMLDGGAKPVAGVDLPGDGKLDGAQVERLIDGCPGARVGGLEQLRVTADVANVPDGAEVAAAGA